MNCKKCGSLLTENDQFRKNCGASVIAQEEQNNVQQSVNNQADLMQQTVNNQPDLTQHPMNIAQPINNMQQNYSNSNQNSWQNNYNPTPNYQQQKPNSNGKFIGIGIAVVVVIVGIIFGMKFFGNGGNNNYSGGNSGGSEISNNTNSTYSVRFKGFTFKIPTNLIYNTDSDTLYIGDEADTWQAAIVVVSGSFNQLQSNKNNLITVYQQAGYGAANVNQKTYGGLDFITIELTHSGQKAILGFAKANSMYLFGATTYNLDNSFDYNLLSNVAKVLSTAEYSGETNNISGFNKVDMGPVSDLVK